MYLSVKESYQPTPPCITEEHNNKHILIVCRVLTGGRTDYKLTEDVQGVELREKLIERKSKEKSRRIPTSIHRMKKPPRARCSNVEETTQPCG